MHDATIGIVWDKPILNTKWKDELSHSAAAVPIHLLLVPPKTAVSHIIVGYLYCIGAVLALCVGPKFE